MKNNIFKLTLCCLASFFLTSCSTTHQAGAGGYQAENITSRYFKIEKFLASNQPINNATTQSPMPVLQAYLPINFGVRLTMVNWSSSLDVRLVIQSAKGETIKTLIWRDVWINSPNQLLTTDSNTSEGLPGGDYTALIYADPYKRFDLLSSFSFRVDDCGCDESTALKVKLSVNAFTLAASIDKKRLNDEDVFEPVKSGTSFPTDANFLFFAKLTSVNSAYQKVELEIEQNDKIIWLKELGQISLAPDKPTTTVYSDHPSRKLLPGAYTARLFATTSLYGEKKLVASFPFVIVKPPLPPTPTTEEQLAKITNLKKSLNEKIKEAGKEREYFKSQVESVKLRIAQSTDLPKKKLARLDRDLKRKQSYLKLIDDYFTEFSDRLDTLEEIEDEFHDRSRWRNLIDNSFISRVNQEIQEITALLNDTPAAKPPVKKSNRKERRKRR